MAENSSGRSTLTRRLGIAVVVLLVAVVSYYLTTREEHNPITGEDQRVALSVEQEIALGLQARPEMMQEYGGLDPSQEGQQRIDRIGERIVAQSAAGQSPYKFEFHLLDDAETVNAFALPGGQIFMTEGLYKLLDTDEEIAGVLAHEVGHVIARHSSEQMARAKLTEGLAKAGQIAVYDPENPQSSEMKAKMAQLVSAMVSMKYGRDDELESDDLGVRFMVESNYDPHAMIEVMKVLDQASQGNRPPEFMSTHPDPDNRIEKIKAAIAKYSR
ncbi:MAG: M48 family metallopeptidase [Leptospiraceae bacterium]|nr:M48 family metallopeptidase [Leptospiraceae bacterium]MCB1314548.1 M48 family metallopeptidase [Leptospiraceae bacterium]